jgi:hypothetical protein
MIEAIQIFGSLTLHESYAQIFSKNMVHDQHVSLLPFYFFNQNRLCNLKRLRPYNFLEH